MNKHRLAHILGPVAILLATVIHPASGWAEQQGTEQPAAQESDDSQKSKGTNTHPMGLPDLEGGLRAIEGCIKVVGAKTSDGKSLVIGWFEDKDAVKRWYYTEMHQAVLDRFYPMRIRDREALHWVEDDTGPIMVVASITFPEPGEPISQIAIELYTPLHGGFAMGGLFGPDEFKDVFMHYDQYGKEELEEQAEQGDATDSAAKAKEGEAGS